MEGPNKIMRSNAKLLLTFAVLVFLISCVPYALLLHSHRILAGGGLVARFLMWSPAFADFREPRTHED